MILCSCDVLSDTFIKAAIKEHQDEVRAETTMNRAAAVVWRATHPAMADGHHKERCASCIGHIREAIEDMGLRGEQPVAAPPACAKTCGTSGVSCAAPCLSK
jgi:hypothetical protein